MNPICQHRFLMMEERAGPICFTYWKGWSFSIQHPLFLCGTGNWVSKANWTPPAKCGEQENRSTGPSCWHLGKTKGLLDVWCPLVQSSFLPNQSPLAKYWGRRPATLVCQYCESSPGGEKENTFMCWPHPVFPLLSLLLPLPFIFLSVLQDPLLPNLWTPYEHVTLWATVK